MVDWKLPLSVSRLVTCSCNRSITVGSGWQLSCGLKDFLQSSHFHIMTLYILLFCVMTYCCNAMYRWRCRGLFKVCLLLSAISMFSVCHCDSLERKQLVGHCCSSWLHGSLSTVVRAHLPTAWKHSWLLLLSTTIHGQAEPHVPGLCISLLIQQQQQHPFNGPFWDYPVKPVLVPER